MSWPLGWVLLVLFAISLAYNELAGMINHRTNGLHPLAAVEVALGTAYTIAGAWLADGECIGIWTIFFCFVASGTPMIIGDVFRWLAKIRR